MLHKDAQEIVIIFRIQEEYYQICLHSEWI